MEEGENKKEPIYQKVVDVKNGETNQLVATYHLQR